MCSQQCGTWYNRDVVGSKPLLQRWHVNNCCWAVGVANLALRMVPAEEGSRARKSHHSLPVLSVCGAGTFQDPEGFLFTITITHKQLSHIVFSILSSIRCGTTEWLQRIDSGALVTPGCWVTISCGRSTDSFPVVLLRGSSEKRQNDFWSFFFLSVCQELPKISPIAPAIRAEAGATHLGSVHWAQRGSWHFKAAAAPFVIQAEKYLHPLLCSGPGQLSWWIYRL